ncbi:MAG: surfeit locus 1 family protein [Candidatus Tokpelaia sp. JSC189]|nr:MAG: surfeit locus 1 family protein [Candidatus Tokpelaia sp. JSC189]
MTHASNPPKIQRTSSIVFSTILRIIIALFFCLFTGLGIWQMQRLFWKNDLIARVNQKIHLPAVYAPSKPKWLNVTAACCDYMPVRVTGHFLNDKEVLITTLTAEGTGYWLLTPFETPDGSIIFINRGFVPMDRKKQVTRTEGLINNETTVNGILRMGEKNGFYPRRNNPTADRWYTRELPAMAKARRLSEVAPYFIDADETANIGGIPIGGLTAISFPNNHFVYALTWFALAVLVFLAGIFVLLNGQKKHRHE